MGFPWVKKILKPLAFIGKTGLIPVPGLREAILIAEAAVTGVGEGATKGKIAKAILEQGDEVAVAIHLMTPEQKAQYDALRDRANDLIVAGNNAEAELMAFVRSFKPPTD